MVAIIGLGYVGLPLAMRFAEVGCTVMGIDVDDAKVAKLNAAESHLPSVTSTALAGFLENKKLAFSADFSRIRDCTSVIICVPTPLNKNREPELAPVRNATLAVGAHLQPRMLVVLESTSYPGTTDEIVVPCLEKKSGLKAGVDFHVAYSPEREDPGNPDSNVSKVPKVVGGLTPKCLELAVALYEKVAGKVVAVSNCQTAEATKLMENIFRSVNIALVNELKVVYAAMGIDVWEVIAAASTKPFGFMPFFPGPGLGGHCIPIDPFYLTWKAREFQQNCKFVELAGEINTAMPEYVVARTGEALNHHGKPFKGSRILIIGLAYKANVGDDRESPSYRIIELLLQRGALISYHDPHVAELHDHSGKVAGSQKSIPWDKDSLRAFDAAIIVTSHRAVPLQLLVDHCPCIVDTRNALNLFQTTPGQIWKA